MFTRRKFTMTAPLLLTACAPEGDTYGAAIARTWKLGALKGLEGVALQRELVRYATLAPSSHNTQCWKFGIEEQAITILPDLSRRCPAVDPDDHHLFVSLGCAAENLSQAALAHGLKAELSFDASRDALRVALQPTAAATSPMFQASRSARPHAANTTASRCPPRTCACSNRPLPAVACNSCC